MRVSLVGAAIVAAAAGCLDGGAERPAAPGAAPDGTVRIEGLRPTDLALSSVVYDAPTAGAWNARLEAGFLPEVRLNALQAFIAADAGHRAKAAAGVFVDHLDRAGDLRRWIADGRVECGPLLSAIEAALADGEDGVHLQARRICAVAARASSGLEGHTSESGSPPDTARLRAALARPGIIRALALAAEAGDREAPETLARIGSPAAIEALTRCLQADNRTVASAAMDAVVFVRQRPYPDALAAEVLRRWEAWRDPTAARDRQLQKLYRVCLAANSEETPEEGPNSRRPALAHPSFGRVFVVAMEDPDSEPVRVDPADMDALTRRALAVLWAEDPPGRDAALAWLHDAPTFTYRLEYERLLATGPIESRPVAARCLVRAALAEGPGAVPALIGLLKIAHGWGGEWDQGILTLIEEVLGYLTGHPDAELVPALVALMREPPHCESDGLTTGLHACLGAWVTDREALQPPRPPSRRACEAWWTRHGPAIRELLARK